jgi:hypothetical protein
LDQTLWLYWEHCYFILGKGAVWTKHCGFSGSSVALYLKWCSLDQTLWLYWEHCCFILGRGAVWTECCGFSGSTAASYLEGLQFGPNAVALLGALLLYIRKGCSLDQTLWLYWEHCCFILGRGAVWTKHCGFVGSTAASYLEGVQFKSWPTGQLS